MGGISEEAIRERAYHIWVREGHPQGREFEHWVQAQIELEAEARGNGGAKPVRRVAPKRAAKANAAVKAARPTAQRSPRARKT